MLRKISLISIAAKHQIVHRVNVIFFMISILIQMWLMIAVWSSLRGQQIGKFSLQSSDLIFYTMIGFLMSSAMFTMFTISNVVGERIKKGDIVVDLMKPVMFIDYYFFRYLGAVLFRIVFVITPVFVVSLYFFSIPSSVTLESTIAFGVSFSISVILNYFLWISFTMFLFVSSENAGLTLLFNSSSSIFSGLYIPLWFFPDWLRLVADFLPFKSVYFTPLTILLNREGISIFLILEQLAWILILASIVTLLWKRISATQSLSGG